MSKYDELEKLMNKACPHPYSYGNEHPLMIEINADHERALKLNQLYDSLNYMYNVGSTLPGSVIQRNIRIIRQLVEDLI
jgi:hypothetical protein